MLTQFALSSAADASNGATAGPPPANDSPVNNTPVNNTPAANVVSIHEPITIGNVVIDLDRRLVRVGAKRVPLTGREFDCLAFLVRRRGITLTKEMFLAQLYSGRDEPELKIIDVFICKVRRKFADAGAEPFIETVWGRGYMVR
jgi:DNA-binding response OmpR family regulator